MGLIDRWKITLNTLKSQDRYRNIRAGDGIDFTSNDYLGYGHGRCPISVEDQASLPVTGMGSRLLRGHHPIWEQVEAQLAQWHGAESVLMMTSGFTANEGLLTTVIEPGDWVAADERCHASIYEALRICRPRKYIFKHNDLNHLEDGLRQEAQIRPVGREMFIVTESIFSMDGDLAPLQDIVELAERYGAHLIVDEAHSTGCYGVNGSGLVDALHLRSRVLATVHTGGKALGLCGAYICGSHLLKEYLINRCRHLIFTTALPPLLGAYWCKGIQRVINDNSGRELLFRNVQLFRSLLHDSGWDIRGDSYIVPIVVGEDNKAVRLAQQLWLQGWDIRAIRPPSVPEYSARLRISLHADHTPDCLENLALRLRSIFTEYH
ncbi:aminotransferase class I/II-fold pyridoxal phosphate-dependent enzyme [Thermogemmata fonticola]|jgi:8-amino-7-oxononanoate synthase|uniref:8-amino-7-oxononanoate synthase n=1 Tax=Thermogemmata fonticola TaxID=2755323 RepID=A0A7V8VD47_9BACT|nr:8-amino-7-oxononanoate synthase [Thermogemmata fonticola]MBA2225860.1 8-amino-7-oxononanoate synthase [Thermogemmata fonticola]